MASKEEQLGALKAMISVFEVQESQLRKELSAITKGRREAELAIAELRHGVKIGGVVKDAKGTQHKVTEIDTKFGRERPWVEGHPMRKDGQWGEVVRHLYEDWEAVQ